MSDDDLWIWGLLGMLVVSFGGWVLGIIGFFRANRALLALETLRSSASRATMTVYPVVPPPEPTLAPEPEPTPQPAAAEAPVEAPLLPPPARDEPLAPPPLDIEALLTMRWGVWLGAAALMFAGIFLIRYAADQGLLGPATRCVFAALLGLILTGVGEYLRRRQTAGPHVDQVPSSLAAGGLAVLFGAAYGAGPYYDLVPMPVGFGLMAAAAMAALALSLLHGQLVAAIGIVGAFATPALVHTDAPSLPGLFSYLLLVTAAALAVVRYTAWIWLGWAATVAGGLWVLLVLDTVTAANIWAPSLFVPAAASLHLGLLPRGALDSRIGRRLAWIPFATLGIAGLILCNSLDDALPRLGIILMAPVAVWAGAKREPLDRLPWLAALFALVMLLIWQLPPWQPTGEPVRVGTEIRAVLPGAWAPGELQPLLGTSVAIAAFFALAGLWFERVAPRPLRWAALPAAVPVSILALTYARIENFQTDAAWAIVAIALMGFLVYCAHRARKDGSLQRAGIHAAGAVTAFALGCGMILTDHWLSMAIALVLPALAWIEEATDLPALRRVALAIASIVLCRLLLNWYVLDYAFGSFPIVNGLIVAYGVPAAAFAFAAHRFARRGDDLTVAVLRSGAAALGTVFVAAEIHLWATGGTLNRPVHTVLEAALHIDALGFLALALLRINRRAEAAPFRWAWQSQGGLALFGAVALLLFNPAITGAAVGKLPILNALLAAYAIPALLALIGASQAEIAPREAGTWIRYFAVIAGFTWLSLETRHFYHPANMVLEDTPIRGAELWSYSGVWLLYGIALLGAGITLGARHARLAGLAMFALVTLKVFLWDMGGLDGLWRVVSFLGLGLSLIGLGAIYRRFVAVESGAS
jgi:uncharacterized membrane protein